MAKTVSRKKTKDAASAARKRAMRFPPLDPSRALPSGLRWFALSVRPNAEFQIAAWLEARGWFTLVPTFTAKRLASPHKSGRNAPRIEVTIPQIGGIVFAGAASPPDWLSLKTASKIRGPLHCQGTPLQIPGPQIARLQREAATITERRENRSRLKEGGKAVMLAGPFEGYELDITQIRGKWATFIVRLMGTEIPGRTDVDSLKAA